MKTNLKLIYILFSFFFIGSLFVSCDKDSENVSKVVTYPTLELQGEAFINVKMGTAFTDPGAIAKAGDEVLDVTTKGTVNTAKAGIYELEYSAEVEGDIPVKATVTRKVFVTEDLMTKDLYSGTYQAVGRSNTMKVTKIGDGYYKASDSWFQSKAIPVEFLDYGGTTGLVALPGSSVYGNFTCTLTYDNDAFNFKCLISEGVNAGVSWNTNWKKVN